MRQIHDVEKLINDLRGKQYPISIRDIPPHTEAKRLTGKTPSGLSSGFHTGGAWLFEGHVYKPCDGRPHGGANCHFATQELEILIKLMGKDLFPKNWEVVEANGRIFIIRSTGALIPDDLGWDYIDQARALWVERAIMEMNHAGWQINDDIALAVDGGKRHPIYLYDLSAANEHSAADERDRVMNFFRNAGLSYLVKLRCNARDIMADLILKQEYDGFPWIYASMRRPPWIGMKFPCAVKFIDPKGRPSWSDAQPHTWIVTDDPLEQQLCDRYELELGWYPSPRFLKLRNLS